MRVGEAVLVWGVGQVGVYLTDVEELESEAALRRREATGILDWGDERQGNCGCGDSGSCVCNIEASAVGIPKPGPARGSWLTTSPNKGV